MKQQANKTISMQTRLSKNSKKKNQKTSKIEKTKILS